MTKLWMVRAGERGFLADDFEREGVVAIGWHELGDFSHLTSETAIRQKVDEVYVDRTPQARSISASQAHKFRNVVCPGDRVVSYDPEERSYLVGTVTGDFEYAPGVVPSYNNVRRVRWEGRVSRDALKQPSRNSLGGLLTIFEPGDDVLADLEGALRDPNRRTRTRGRSASLEFSELFADFVEDYLTTDASTAHRTLYRKGVERGRANFQAILAAEARGEDVTDLVLTKLLPHTDSARHREGGEWIHIAPAITKDIRSWYEGARLVKPEEWPDRARFILDFVKRLNAHPEEVEQACQEFSESQRSKGLQSGMLSPILNALRPDHFSVINSKVVKTFEALTGQRFKTALSEYPQANSAVRELVRQHAATLSTPREDDLDVHELFDMFSHWFVAVREEVDLREGGSEDGATTRRTFDRASEADARRAVENICPDAAPRATCLETLAKAILFAHDRAPASWSITLHPSLLRLNVGGIVAIDLRRQGLYLTVHEPSLTPDVVKSVRRLDAGDEFRYLEGAVGYLVPYAELDPNVALLWEGCLELIRRSLQKSEKAPFRSAHSPGVLALLRSVGHEVPDPRYARTSGGGGRVREPEDPDYVVKHPVISLDEVAAEVGVDAARIEGWVRAINRKGQAVIYGPPGTGKTFVAERLARYLLSGGDGLRELVQFHPAYSYEDFIQGLRPQLGEGGQLHYELVSGRFIEFCESAAKRSGVSVLIIDEINRANLSQVFGELMYLLEYRDQELPLAGGRRLRIPPNVRIIGTMNTADRSIALVDHALRRRFAFIPLHPDLEVLRRFHARQRRDVSGLANTLQRLNAEIADPHYAIGISFFMREDLEQHLEPIWTGEIEPYLEELFFDRKALVDNFRWTRVQQEIALQPSDDGAA